ncbi:MAG: caspase family protein [Alphaproteobacteria bacterium]|nr:caspase family protein [Alphaproteobacteria bacterium]
MFGIGKAPRRKAFILGISEYDHSARLNNTVNDAHAIATQLEALGFEVKEYHNLDFVMILRALTDFLGVEPDKEELEAILIYYAGHGIQLGDQNYIVPKDFDRHSAFPIGQLISIDRVLELMDERAKKKILFLDACRDTGGLRVTNPGAMMAGPVDYDETANRIPDPLGLVTTTAPTRGLDGKKGLARPHIGNLDQTFIAFAADPGEKALDGLPGEPNSPFTAGVLKYADRRGFDVFDMCQSAARYVRHKTDHAQVPWTHSNLMDQFEFHRADRWPEFVLAVMGMIAGVLTAIATFDLFDIKDGVLVLGSGRLSDVRDEPIYLVTSTFLGTALGIGAWKYAKPLHSWWVLLSTCAIYTAFAIGSRFLFAPIADLDGKVAQLGDLDTDKLWQLFDRDANLDDKNVMLLIAVLFFAVVAGALAGLGSVLASAPFHHEMRRSFRMVCGAAIGMLAPLFLFAFLAVRFRINPDVADHSNGEASCWEVAGIIALVSIWQGLLAWNVGRGYAKPRYDST